MFYRNINTSDGEPILLCGITLDLFNWYKESKIIRSLWEKKAGLTLDQFLKSLASVDPADSIKSARECIISIWDKYPELGPYFLLDELIQAQENLQFYPDYRDHVSHQLKVFLLGLYIYENCSILQNPINEEIKSDSKTLTLDEIKEEFILRWITATLFHDIGYVWESDEMDPSKAGQTNWEKVEPEVNKVFSHPISRVGFFREKKISYTIESEIIQALNLTERRVSSYQKVGMIKMEKDTNYDLLHKLEDAAIFAGLGEKGDSEPIFRRYYKFAHEKSPNNNRSGYWDHGITGAMFLLQSWEYYKERLHDIYLKLEDLLKKQIYNPEIEKKIKQLESSYEKNQKTIIAGATAIALHNINLSQWDESDLNAKKITKNRFSLRLNRDPQDFDKERGTGLAFLLALCDSIQDWGRPKFGPGKFRVSENSLSDKDLSIHVNANEILLFYRKDGDKPEKDQDSRFSKMKRILKENLDPEIIERLIKHNNKLAKEYTNEETPKTTKKVDEEDANYKQNASRIKFRIGDLLSHDQNDSLPESKCLSIKRKHNNQSCRLLWRSLYLTSELNRAALTVFKLVTIYHDLSSILEWVTHEILPYFDLKNDEKNQSPKRSQPSSKNIRNLVIRVESLLYIFNTDFSQKEPDSKWEDRLKKFLNLQSNNITRIPIDEFIKCLEEFHQFNGTVAELEEKKLEEFAKYCSELEVYGSLWKNELFAIIQDLTAEVNSIVISNFKNYDFSTSEVFFTTASNLLHNQKPKLQIWEENEG